MGTKDMEMSMPSVTARGVCTCERLRVIRTAATDIESATPKKSAAKRLSMESAACQSPPDEA